MLFETANIRVQADDQIATLWFDFPGQTLNGFTPARLAEFDSALRAVEHHEGLDILVLRSGRPVGFSAGHDLAALATMSPYDALHYAESGQAILTRLEQLAERVLTIAFLDGPTFGAGLELALACEYRLALARPATQLGFPDVMRGVMPGWGATQRLPQLIGLDRALEMLQTGQAIGARQALKWGLIDHAFCERRGRIEVRSFLSQLQEHPRRRSRWMQKFALWNPLEARRAWKRSDARLTTINALQDPAPHRIADVVRCGMNRPEEGMIHERSAFATVLQSPAAQQGLRLAGFLNQPIAIHPAPQQPIPLPTQHIGIIGGTDLGTRLARFHALGGRQVSLQDSSPHATQQTNHRLERLFAEAIEQGQCTPLEAKHANQLIQRTSTWVGFDQVGLVIEAVDDEPMLKRAALRDCQEQVRLRVPIATTTTTLSMSMLQCELQRPQRLIGLHFPPTATELVEIVRGESTDALTCATVQSWLRAWGFQPLLVSDQPGRVLLRTLLAYWSESVLLVAEGLTPTVIDQAMTNFGMTAGPLSVLDQLGLDRVGGWVRQLQATPQGRALRNLSLEPMIALGWTGVGAGEGFYRYRGQKRQENDVARMLLWRDMDEEMTAHYIFDPDAFLRDGVQRLLMRTINEAARCLTDDHAACPRSIDAVMILGGNWAIQHAGPLHYADQYGLPEIVREMNWLSERYGPRFAPCQELLRRAEAGESFHGTLAEKQLAEQVIPTRLAG